MTGIPPGSGTGTDFPGRMEILLTRIQPDLGVDAGGFVVLLVIL